MMIEAKNKGKEAVSAMEKGKEVVPLTDEDVVVEEPRSGKCWNYGHYHEGGPTQFCKVHAYAPRLHEALPRRADGVKLKTNTGSQWRVIVQLMNGRVNLDRGWALFAVVHQIKIRYLVTFKLLTHDTLKVTVFNDDGIEVVTKCGRHNDAFAVNV
ncbi:hypothetical protein CFC21_043431 [Triticum aestivum]|uniref:TF-B3 domain-containing protein n=2 Tax=Triticum aestivum TaxID=4565 RepID=A0A3B6FXZ3_WHEAT|nr:hypothetical protein CFC21_043431 [Triticum aestivum]